MSRQKNSYKIWFENLIVSPAGGWDQWRSYVLRRAGVVITMVANNRNYELKIQPVIEISSICLPHPCQ